MVIQAMFGKCTSTASRQTLTGSRYAASLLHGTCWTCIFPSTTEKIVPLNSSSSGISPASRLAKYRPEPISRS